VQAATPLSSRRTLLCTYCGRATELHSRATLFPDRPDIPDRLFWVCWPCEAWVGCHGNTDEPLGTVADASLREARTSAHEAFDPIWKGGPMSRPEAYAWLSRATGISHEKCHIGMMNLDECSRVKQLVQERFGGTAKARGSRA
jgi:hypothetical protein